MLRHLTAVAFGVLLVCAAPRAAAAQTLEGRVLDGTSHQPLADARLQLLAPEGTSLGEPVVSGEDGSFVLNAPRPGSYYVRVELLSYRTLVDGVFELEQTRSRMEVVVYLQRTPIELEGVEASVEGVATRRHLRAAGFYERAAAGFGDFFGPEVTEALMSGHVTDHFRAIPGVNLRGGILKFKNPHPFKGAYCEPNIWLDGVLIGGLDGLGYPLGDVVRAEDVVAIEVYRTVSGTPLQWTTVNTSCGTVVIWTKQGR